MMVFVIAAIMVAATCLLVWLIDKAAGGSVLAGAAAFGIVTVLMGLVLNYATKSEAKGPCHEYKTSADVQRSHKNHDAVPRMCSTWRMGG